MPEYPYTEPKQKLEGGRRSICPKCFHREVCRGTANQPCIECNQYISTSDVRPGQATVPMNERDADGLSLYLRNLAGSNAGLTNYDRDLLRDASKLIDEFHDALKQERRRRLMADPTEVNKHEADPV